MKDKNMNIYEDGEKYETPSLLNLNLKVENFIYPIARVMRNKIVESGLDPKELAVKDKYDHFMFGKYFSKGIVNKISRFVKVDKTLFDRALEDTQLLISIEKYIDGFPELVEALKDEINEQKKFFPFLYRKTSITEPSSITVAGMCGGAMKYEFLPKNFKLLSFEEQVEKLNRMIIKDFADRKGQCTFFGEITGYYFQREYHTIIEFDIEGNVIGEIKDVILYPNPL